MYLTRSEIEELIQKKELVVRPLLDPEGQIGEVTMDLRLGTDFLISFQGRDSFIDASSESIESRPIHGFFSKTRRRVGESILFHPQQTVLCSTLEYIKLPEDVFVTLSMRSSYSRLGLSLSSIVQPGYCGCISLELTNHNNNPLKVRVGAAIVQARFFKLESPTEYLRTKRKYLCQVRPIASKANEDKDLELLEKLLPE
jgi:dCTP deaminase